MTPLEYYREKIHEGLITEDVEQLRALVALQKTYDDLLQTQKNRKRFFSGLRKPNLVSGLYLWGSVGIGKTFLLDCFYHCLPFPEKVRMHFYEFMQWVHLQLKTHQGKKNPLQQIAKTLAKKTLVLCFDELIVSDITDAMLLGSLFKALFAEGVCLVATSNTEPSELYKNGLQRELFLPAIAALKAHCTIIHVPTIHDYRIRHLQKAGVFYTPHNSAAQQNMEKSFDLFAHHQTVYLDPIEIHRRLIKIKKRTDNIIWFDFNDICSQPRSQQDYLAIAKQFRTIFISNIPIILPHEKNRIILFIRLIDVFYAARVRLIFSAAKSVNEICLAHDISDYARTRSRLIEMQSENYFCGNY